MSPPWSALLVLVLLDEAGSSVRSVVTFNPNWDKIFQTESLTMTCDVRSPIPGGVSYTWYKDNRRIHTGQSFTITYARTEHSGNYQCGSTKTERSDPVRLDVIYYDWVILQAPLYVHEGDDVTLRCHHYPGYTGRNTKFYKDNDVIRNGDFDPELHIKDINLIRSRGYKCTKEVSRVSWSEYSAESSIHMRELFTTPEMKVTPSPVIEGDNVTVTCRTDVSPYRPETELHFAFHKEGRNVQSFGSSDQYGVQSAQPEDSGKYSCDVRTVSGGMIMKRSKEFNIEINEFSQPEIIMTPNQMSEGDTMTLTCHTRPSPLIPHTGLEFAFYKDGHNVQEFSLSDQYGVQSAQPKHSGNYSCDVRPSSNNLTKSSNELNVQVQGGDEYNIQNMFRLILSGIISLICFLFIVYHIKFIKSLQPENKRPRPPRLGYQ